LERYNDIFSKGIIMKDKLIIKSISYKQDDIINSIIKLHCKSQIEIDPTYGNGNFYKGKVKEPTFKLDINQKFNDVIPANVLNLPIKDNIINTAIFDPPFLATTGKSLEIENSSNKINKRFGVFSKEKELHTFYSHAIKEFYRVLKNKGILIFKCQDKISSGKQYLSHVFIIKEAEKVGFYVKDLFILLAKNRLIANWQRDNQKNARKFHCYFIVLQKTDKVIRYM